MIISLSIGWTGMMITAKILAASTIDLLSDPANIKAAKNEFKIQMQGKAHISLLAPDAKVPTSQ